MKISITIYYVTVIMDCLNATSIEIGNDFILTSSDVIVILQIYGQFGAIQEPDSERMVCNTSSLLVTFYWKNL